MALSALTVSLLSSTVFAVPKQPQLSVQSANYAPSCDSLKIRPTPYRPKKQSKVTQWLTFIVTAYTANDSGMNGRAVTYSGTTAIPFHTVAASSRWPIGTQFKTSDGQLWTVTDRGGAITADNRIDLYVGRHDRQTALQWGVRKIRVQLIKLGGVN